ncbi:unnamed protein product [Ranitomeya imitator]|uniref:VWFA domain-containing protein n=1 Tax=Ranitomeya imitator TaxID=111125 RepID=A0ABN9MNM3_9NEOB|nr:unnamed protein product [Ranitomeya imitator]
MPTLLKVPTLLHSLHASSIAGLHDTQLEIRSKAFQNALLNLVKEIMCWPLEVGFHLIKAFGDLLDTCIHVAKVPESGGGPVFSLFDDSFSVGDPELESVRNFLLSFAVVKFASFPEKIFNFKDYQNGKGEEGILGMKHLGGGTKIYKAINFTLNEIFTPVAGAREQAKKILLLLSDGDSHDSNNGVIEATDQQKVTRYVGKNFISLRDKIAKLASYPTDKHTEVLTDYSRLVGFFNELQSKILAIEGVAQGSNFTQEMSSAGLSAVLTAASHSVHDLSTSTVQCSNAGADGNVPHTYERDVLGDPGIFDWSGGILNVSMQGGLAYMSRNDDEKYGYLGYSVELLHTGNGSLYFGGFSSLPVCRTSHCSAGSFLENLDGRRWIPYKVNRLARTLGQRWLFQTLTKTV